MIKEVLDWDSKFFGFPVEKIVLDRFFSEEQFRMLLAESSADVTYIYAPQELSSEQETTISNSGAVKYDIKTTLEKQVISSSVSSEIVKITEAADELEQLAWEAGVYSRYNSDPRFRPYFRPLYSEWLRKAFADAGSVMLAVMESGKIAGMVIVTLTETAGKIELLAVAPEFRGRSLGSKLLNAADAICLEHSRKICSVVTQQQNIPACKLYLKNGYIITKQEAVWHRWKVRNREDA
jgi:ribosomal protein S18 acetylase RimI-like enzyme